jgi:hypothetical protein
MPHQCHRVRRPLICAYLAMAGLLSGAGHLHAEPSADDKALATLLFQEARALMSGGQFAEACPKLQESQRLDPGGGTILNLAMCHEREGRLARSWSEFKEALLTARRDGRPDRELEAANQVAALEPRLSRLTIVVPAGAQVGGLLVERDGGEVNPGAWSTAIPIDGGAHVVRATAPGRDPFVMTVIIGKEWDSRTVEIPVLATPVVVVSPPPPAPSLTPTRLRWAGIGAAGAGLLLLAGSGYALSTAIDARDASKADCWSDGCDGAGLERRHEAVSRGNLATWLGVGGVALVGAGATLFFLERPSRPSSQQTRAPARLVVGAAPGAVVTGIQGRF